jgi:hypothetical protein
MQAQRFQLLYAHLSQLETQEVEGEYLLIFRQLPGQWWLWHVSDLLQVDDARV